MDLLGRLLQGSRSLLSLSIDARGQVADVNPALARAVGMAPDALVGLSVEGLVRDEDRARVEPTSPRCAIWCRRPASASTDSPP